ncbi:beta strand repeat-containing protein, partial [Altererythrobacter sp. MF3-039]|uniref:beta strand repeat-containing protein n=1 Tax=Altererythrobacter sp. MF3-039 TaxID=3252901 RepID=UPI00390C5B19
VTADDTDGSSDSAVLDVEIVDDVPTANADTDSVSEGGTADGNVFTGVGGSDANATDGVADVTGADGATVTGVAAGAVAGPVSGNLGGVGIAGDHGTLILNADGSYTYESDPNSVTAPGDTDVFTYTIMDGDGDTSTTTLTINIDDVTLVADNDDVTVNEAALDLVQDDRPGTIDDDLAASLVTGSQPGLDTETVSGQLNVAGNGVTYSLVNFTGNNGEFNLNADGSYTYTLTDPVDGPDNDNSTNTFNNVETVTYLATDADGNTVQGTITIDVIDDVPTARPDTDSVVSGGEADGNVFTGVGGSDANMSDGVADEPGADGATVTGVAAGNVVGPVAGNLGGLGIAGSFGTLTLNADGSYTYEADPNVTGVDVFTYTITDGDGDTSTTTLTINVNPSDLAASNEDAIVDEAALDLVQDDRTGTINDDLAPGTVTGSLPGLDTETVSGNLSDNTTGGAGGNTFAIVGSNLGTYGQIQINSDGTWTYTLTAPVDGPTADNGANTLNNQETFTYEVTDSDGNTTQSTITIDIKDDIPTASADTDSVTEGALLDSGTDSVLDNDEGGADGIQSIVGVRADGNPADTTSDVSGGVGNPIAGDYGTLTLNADGTYTYQSTANAITGDEQDVFVYTIVDEDGDLSTTTLTIDVANVTLAPDNETAQVEEASLDMVADDRGAPGASVEDDLAAGTVDGSNPGGITETTFGQLNVTDATTYTLVGSNMGSYGQIQINSDGSYTYTLTSPVDGDLTNPDQSGNNGNNVYTGDAVEVFTYEAQDANGNTVQGTITVSIVDDVPTATNDGEIETVDDNATGVVIGTVAEIIANDNFGADGAGSPSVTNISAGSLGGTVTINGGNLVYTSATDITDPYADQVETFTYTIVDGDGDTTTATFQVRLTDGGPVTGTATALLDDDGLTGGNNSNDDLDADVGDAVAGQGDETLWVGTLGGSFGVDSSGGSFSFANLDATSAVAGLDIVTFDWDAGTNTLTATITASPEASRVGTDLFTVEVTDTSTGAYEVNLLQNFLHAGGDNGELLANIASMDLSYLISDGEGESVNGTLTINFGDDAPLDFTPDSGFINDVTDPLVPQAITEALNLSIGADTPAQIAFAASLDGTAVIDQNTLEPVTVGGVALTYYIAPNGDLVATTGASHDTGVEGFRFELDPSTSEYTLTILENLSNGTSTEFNDLTSSAAGNVSFRTIGEDVGDGTEVDVLLSASDNGTQVTVNTDSDSIGAANQSVSAGQTVRIDFLNGITTDGGNVDTGLAWTGQEDTSSFQQFIPQVQGNQAQTTGIDVYALDSTLASGQAPDTDPTDGFGGDSVQITEVTVNKFNGGAPIEFDIADGVSQTKNGITVEFNSGGGETWVTIGGLQEGDQYAIGTGANTFNGVAVTVLDDAGQDWTQDDLDLGIFSIGSFNAGDDIELSVGVTVTDEDGDTADGTIDVTIDQDGSGPPVAPVVLDLDGGGNAFSSLDAGIAYDYSGDGVKAKTAWVAAGSAILAYDINADGMVTDASEFVFGGEDMTDLEALAANYDTNGDGTLDASDSTYGKFGVWLDSNLDGNSDAGEFVSLSDAGITSIELTSDGIAYDAAGGDVTVHGTASFTWADGSTGEVSDASFAVGGNVDAAMDALLTMTADGAQSTQDAGTQQVALAEAMSDVSDNEAIDAIVDYFAGTQEVTMKLADSVNEGHDVLDIGLVNAGAMFQGSLIVDMAEDASALAAAA